MVDLGEMAVEVGELVERRVMRLVMSLRCAKKGIVAGMCGRLENSSVVASQKHSGEGFRRRRLRLLLLLAGGIGCSSEVELTTLEDVSRALVVAAVCSWLRRFARSVVGNGSSQTSQLIQ